MSDRSLPADLLAALAEIESGTLRYESPANFLTSAWDVLSVEQPRGDYSVKLSRERKDSIDAFYRVEESAPVWSLGVTKNFKKDIDGIDKNMRARIFAAILELSENPTQLRGDTVKPLAKELEGCWRYRIGDFRLVYRPNNAARNIALIAFAARGSIYD